MMMPEPTIAELQARIRRLGQVAAIQQAQWRNHDTTCRRHNPDRCRECFRLLMIASVYGWAHQTMTGNMLWPTNPKGGAA
jgi:hypothetical protein